MSLHFQHSLESLRADDRRPTYVVLGLAFVLLLLWAFWFTTAPIARYANGQILQTTPDGWIVAEFPAQAYDRLQLDQRAWLHPQATGNQQVPAIAATVYDFPEQAPASGASARFQVQLYSDLDAQNEDVFANGFGGEVVVEVEYRTPLELLTGRKR